MNMEMLHKKILKKFNSKTILKDDPIRNSLMQLYITAIEESGEAKKALNVVQHEYFNEIESMINALLNKLPRKKF